MLQTKCYFALFISVLMTIFDTFRGQQIINWREFHDKSIEFIIQSTLGCHYLQTLWKIQGTHISHFNKHAKKRPMLTPN